MLAPSVPRASDGAVPRSVMLSSLYLLFALAVHDGWPCYEYDAKNAYCHGVMDVDLWVMPPAGVHIAEA